MIVVVAIIGALAGCVIDATFIHPQPVYGNDWLAPVIGAGVALSLWAARRTA